MTYRFEVWGSDGAASVQVDAFDIVNLSKAHMGGDELEARREELYAEHLQPIYDRIAWVMGLAEDEYLAAGGTHL
jgi:hypothetical protein